MKHAHTHMSPSQPARARSGRAKGRHSKGRHASPPVAANRTTRRMGRRLPIGPGIGLALAVTATTSFTVATADSDTSRRASATERTTTERSSTAAAAHLDEASVAPRVVVDRSAKISRNDNRPERIKITPAPEPEPEPRRGQSTRANSAPEPESEEEPESALAGCDGDASGAGSNGQVPSSELCDLWDGQTHVRADAAVTLAELNAAYTARFGEAMCITDGYRSYDQQVAVKAEKGYLAATPGTSNHGWGLAVDLCPETYAGERYSWLAENAPAFGWDNPPWARPGGSKYEPWHWELTEEVAEVEY
ncbi:M15 family metallopeptidase [Isoptericola sp. NPDC057391]|uniref:M15 family metallopeptidase n=1 Tax=Isoptericola sp. NPDC057391 TaxID=3346117 RepID=UPI0036315701